jgi:hypothetical protein
LDPEPGCIRAFYRVKRLHELQQGVSQDPMADRVNMAALSARLPAEGRAALLDVLVLISCHRGADAGSV